MIGRPEWFTYRILGWGIGPKTWQSYVWGAAYAAAAGIILLLPLGAAATQWSLGILFAILIVDVLHIMTQLLKHHDERENLHQLIIERNCSFAAIAALLTVALYQTYVARDIGLALSFDWSIATVLIAMLAAKIGTTAYVKFKM